MADFLDPLARGDLDAATAETNLKRFFKEQGDPGAVYSALTSWVWHAVTERRHDPELRSWHGLLLDVAFQMRRRDQTGLSERVKGIADMLRISIAMEDRPTVKEVLARAHVPSILVALHGAGQQPVSRPEVLRRVQLQSANLSRLMKLLILSGLVEREQTGKTAHFRLTEAGEHAASTLRSRARIAAAPERNRPAGETREVSEQDAPKLGYRKLEAQGRVYAPKGPNLRVSKIATDTVCEDKATVDLRPTRPTGADAAA